MGTSIKYNGDTISSFSNATKRLTTAGTWLTGNIEVISQDIIPETGGSVYQDQEGYIVVDPGAPTGTLEIVENGVYSTQGYGSVDVDVPTGIDIPVFTITWDSTWTTVESITCNMTFSECYNYVDGGANGGVAVYETDGTDTYKNAASYRIGSDTFMDFTASAGGYPPYDIRYSNSGDDPDGSIVIQIPSVVQVTPGTPTASKGTVSNHSVSVTPSVTNPTGYISGGSVTGTAVTVTASELASGNKAITANGTGIDVVGYSTVSVAVDATYTATITGSGNASYCYVQLNNSTKYYTNGGTFQFKSGDSLYCYARYSSGVSQIIQLNGTTVNSGTTTASYTYTMPAKDIGISLNYSAQGYIYLNESVVPGIYRTATTITPSTSTQTIAAGSYAAGAITISAMPSGSATTPATTITSNPTISVSSSGLITASNSKTQSVTPTVSAGYVSSGTAGTITVSGSSTNQLTTQGATTITPTTSNQTIPAGTYLSGVITIAGDSDLVSANILNTANIFGVQGSAIAAYASATGVYF